MSTKMGEFGSKTDGEG